MLENPQTSRRAFVAEEPYDLSSVKWHLFAPFEDTQWRYV